MTPPINDRFSPPVLSAISTSAVRHFPQRLNAEVLQRQEKSIQILPNLIGIDGDLPSGSAES